MSGLGKSYWSKQFESEGFKRYCCDEMIKARLGEHLVNPDGTRLNLGQWMGFPYDKDYRDRETLYLSLEIAVLNEIADYLDSVDPLEKVIIDTTGSAPYAGDDVMVRIKRLSFVVHLNTSEKQFSKMLERYIEHPRPVLWGDIYRRTPGESQKSALARSYKDLLEFRKRLYLKYAHASVPYNVHRINDLHAGRIC
jgi:hypothetical protein